MLSPRMTELKESGSMWSLASSNGAPLTSSTTRVECEEPVQPQFSRAALVGLACSVRSSDPQICRASMQREVFVPTQSLAAWHTRSKSLEHDGGKATTNLVLERFHVS